MNYIIGINQSVSQVPVNIENSLARLRLSGYKVNESCRFELYKKKFRKLYLNSISKKDYSIDKIAQKELLYGYKDYWELVRISDSNTILSSKEKKVRDEVVNIFSGGILEGKDPKPWNFQFQYNLSSLFEQSGFQVELAEPDFVFEYKGKKYAVAAKRLISKNQIQSNIEDAERQLTSSNNQGFLALSLDKIFMNFNEIISVNDADKTIRKANEIIHSIIREDFLVSYFERRTDQVLGIIACVSFPFILNSDKPLFELGYTSYLLFLPINEPDSTEWNEVLEIGDKLHNIISIIN
ncbi:hypothetical protein [Paenibacillus humicus]|uniref:hypothetical protein n=1 Tax=Paenibacillus humicus TaxID=412861 RepID=UPI003F15DE8D